MRAATARTGGLVGALLLSAAVALAGCGTAAPAGPGGSGTTNAVTWPTTAATPAGATDLPTTTTGPTEAPATTTPGTTAGPSSPTAPGTTSATSPAPTAPSTQSATTATAPTTRTPTTTPTRTTSTPSTPSTRTPTATPTPDPTPTEGDTLHPGDSGAYVRTVQTRLSALGYWLGTPDGGYGALTTQAVLALQKAAGLQRDGVFGPATRRALDAGIRPASRIGGTGLEIDKAKQLILVVRSGSVRTILNTSTGSGQTYVSRGQTAVATTPSGSFSVFRSVDHLDKGPLGDLWRPRYFNGGIAVHGAGSIPAYPASHGCARVSNAAMDMIWANDLMPIGSRVVVY